MQENSHSFKRKIFGLDNKLMRTSAKVFDLMFLNVLFIASCLPIVTIGAAIVSLYQMTRKLREEDTAHIGKEYFQTMKGNMKQGILLGLLSSFAAISVFLNIRIFSSIQHPISSTLQMVTYGIAFIIFLVSLYAFQISSKFKSTCAQVIKNAFFLSFLHFKKSLFLFMTVVPVIFLILYSQFTMLLTLSILLFIGCSVIAYIQTIILSPVFEKYSNKN